MDQLVKVTPNAHIGNCWPGHRERRWTATAFRPSVTPLFAFPLAALAAAGIAGAALNNTNDTMFTTANAPHALTSVLGSSPWKPIVSQCFPTASISSSR